MNQLLNDLRVLFTIIDRFKSSMTECELRLFHLFQTRFEELDRMDRIDFMDRMVEH